MLPYFSSTLHKRVNNNKKWTGALNFRPFVTDDWNRDKGVVYGTDEITRSRDAQRNKCSGSRAARQNVCRLTSAGDDQKP